MEHNGRSMSTALRFSRIEAEKQPQLLQAIRSILTEVGAHNVAIYDQQYWDWQYRQLPTSTSYVYAAWDGDKIIGYYHVPVYRCSINGQKKLIGNIQDVAVDPNYRGSGLFRKLAEFANADLNTSGIDLIYTFPNDKSIHTFLKYNNFELVGAVSAYIRPVSSAGIIRSKVNLFGMEKLFGWLGDSLIDLFSSKIRSMDSEVETIIEVTNEVVEVFSEFSNGFKAHLIRDKAWLNWRYLNSARGKHHVLTLREAGKMTAVLVVKGDDMLGNPALLIMDFAHLPGKEASLLHLIDQVRKQPQLTGSKFNLMFVSGLSPVLDTFKEVGFIRIPNQLNPRTLNLLTRTCSEMDGTVIITPDNWLLTLGDWDVF